MNHSVEIRHVPNAIFPRTDFSARHWAPGWRMICSCGAQGQMRHTEDEARIDRSFHVGDVPLSLGAVPQVRPL